MKIKHAAVIEGAEIGYHVAEVKEKVAPHVHRYGDELYVVLKGTGKISIGKAFFERDKVKETKWEAPLEVRENDVFNIPAGYVHSLENTADTPLIISFICNHTHLTTDRIVL